MNKIQIISLSIILSLRTFAQLFSLLTANAEDGIHQIDDPIINAYVSELNVKSELFKIRNYGYGGGINGIDENDKYYKEYLNRCSNVEAVDSPFERFRGAAQAGYCVGMSVLSILSHNGIITPNDISSGANYIYDIELDDDVLSSILAYQTQQLNPHFLHYMNWSLAHYTNEEKVDILLKIAERSAKKGEYFLIVADAKNFSHAMAGLGIVDGEWEFNGVKYDKFIPCYDCNAMVEDKETSTLYASGFSADGSIFINSKTKETYMHFYYNIGKCDGLSFFACDDYDLMNYKGKINPSDSYISKTSNIERIDLSKKSECSLTVEREDGSIYDGISSRNKVFKSENGNVYFCDGSKFNVINEAHENELSVNFYNIKNAAFSSFNGMVKNIEKTEKYFGFNVDEETTYDVKLVFEKDYYNFAPHYKFELSGVTNSDFKAMQTEEGVVLCGTNGVYCNIKTSDILRDENGLIISATENIQEDSIYSSESIMIAFKDNKLKYYIGDNFDEEIQKGDVNCDGHVDASDATAVLQAYSSLSTGGKTYINKSIADWNNDGAIDSSDASAILQKYAELSTT